jgi:Helix-turn-helix domain
MLRCTKIVKNTIQDTGEDIMSKTYLTVTHLAARWHLTPHTLSQWRWNGKGPHFSKMGKKILYDLNHIEAFEERAVHQNTSYLLDNLDIPLNKEDLL